MSIFSRELSLPETNEIVSTGWIPPLLDLRDYTVDHPDIASMAKELGLSLDFKAPFVAPTAMDLRPWCSPVEN
jgi:hypothetical protein